MESTLHSIIIEYIKNYSNDDNERKRLFVEQINIVFDYFQWHVKASNKEMEKILDKQIENFMYVFNKLDDILEHK